MGVIERNVPVTYELVRIGLQLNDAGEIEAKADMRIRNADGLVIDTDHPVTTLTAQEEQTFRAWVLGKLDVYEIATGLTRYVPEEPI